VFFIFITVDGEDLARKLYRRAKYSIKSEGRERKINKVIKKSVSLYIIIYLKGNFLGKYKRILYFTPHRQDIEIFYDY
jgi:hypothetical protein